MDAVLFFCCVAVVAVVAVWQLAAVVLWLHGKLCQGKRQARKETALDRALAQIGREEGFRDK